LRPTAYIFHGRFSGLSFWRHFGAAIALALFLGVTLHAQESTAPSGAAAGSAGPPLAAIAAEPAYTRLNSWSIFGEYAPDSRHIILGVSEGRRLATGGVEYARRLALKPRFELDWLMQVRPVIFERDPELIGYKDVSTGQIVLPIPPERVVQVTHTEFTLLPQNITVTEAYSSQWTYAGGANPIGLKFNFRPRHRFQPFVSSMCGFIWGTRQIPVAGTTAFNFDFEFGGGFETYISGTHSFRVGYSIHHMSNAYVGSSDPGVDSQLMQFTYSFGH
jgi:hypothetical protein